MKRVLIIIFFIIFVVGIMQGCEAKKEDEYLRVHIRANSNEEIDQEVKLKVKDAVVCYLNDDISKCKSKEEAILLLQNNISEIKGVADTVLAINGFAYKAEVKVVKEEFPTRTYGSITLDSGVYDALIIELGEGSGDNWWCIMFPPLCFISAPNANVTYKSYLLELIKKISK